MTVKCVKPMLLRGTSKPTDITVFEDDTVLLSLEAGFAGIPDYTVAEENGWEIVDEESSPFKFFTCAVERHIPAASIPYTDFEAALNAFIAEVSEKMPQGKDQTAARSVSAAWCAGYRRQELCTF